MAVNKVQQLDFTAIIKLDELLVSLLSLSHLFWQEFADPYVAFYILVLVGLGFVEWMICGILHFNAGDLEK